MYRLHYPSFLQDISNLPGQLHTLSRLSIESPQQPPLNQVDMSAGSEATSVISALGTLIGYIGSEAATEDIFERLLWPQRFFNAFSWQDLLQIGLLNPMGGPMHKAALTTLDKFHENGLFKGRDLGNMLGTAFFYDTKLEYKMQDPPPPSDGKEYVRNGLWPQAIARIPVATREQRAPNVEMGIKPRKLVRARSVVNKLELSYVDGEVIPAKTVKNDVGSLTASTILALIWTEVTGIATGVFVLAYWRSKFAFLWFLPLVLKLMSAASTIQREGLLSRPSVKGNELEDTKRFEVNTHGHGFLVVEGKESAVLQFFRHYGHPIRNRVRELMQMAIVVALGLVFPIGLMCSIIWMPTGLQYLWLGYQLYATMALYVHRFTRTHQKATTVARLAQKLAEGNDEEGLVFLQDDKGNTMMGKLTRDYVGNYGEGQKVLQEILARPPKASTREKVSSGGQPYEKCDTGLHRSTSCTTPQGIPNSVEENFLKHGPQRREISSAT